MSPARGTRVIGYVRVSTEEQSASVETQTQRIEQYCALYGLELVRIEVDQASGRTLDRPALTRALAAIQLGDAEGLVIAKLDRLTRSVRDLGGLLESAEQGGWALCSVADQIDTRSAAGRLMLNVLTSVAQWERETISERTKAVLATKRARGVRLGRAPLPVDPAVAAFLRERRAEGISYEGIAAACEERGLARPAGGRWHPTTVRRLLLRLGDLGC